MCKIPYLHHITQVITLRHLFHLAGEFRCGSDASLLEPLSQDAVDASHGSHTLAFHLVTDEKFRFLRTSELDVFATGAFGFAGFGFAGFGFAAFP